MTIAVGEKSPFPCFVRPASFVATAAGFDGTNDYMTRGANLTGISDSKSGLLSLWLKKTGGDGSSAIILVGNDNVLFRVALETDNTFVFRMGNGASYYFTGFTNSTITVDGVWHHVILSWDLASAKYYLYLDGSSSLTSYTHSNNAITYSSLTNWGIGGYVGGGTNKLQADLAELWFSTDYLDITVASNREKFRSSGGSPVDPTLGGLGTPLIYLHSAYSSYGTNSGSGGNFTINGGGLSSVTPPS